MTGGQSGRWARFLVVADTLEPVVMTSGEHSRNRAATLPYVTDSALRGALAARWLRNEGLLPGPGRKPEPIKDERRARFLTVFESGAVRFPVLYLSAPPPLSLHACKQEGASHPLIDLADPRTHGAAGDDHKVRCPKCQGPIDRVGPAGPWHRDRPERRVKEVRTRTAIGDDGTAATAMLYAQEELLEGQRFHGTLKVRPDLLDLDGFTAMVPVGETFHVSVGADRSTSGQIKVRITARPAEASHQSVAARRAAWPCEGELVLTACSPLLLTDQWLRPASRFSERLLQRLLGIEGLTIIRCTVARPRPVAGWNPGAGLPKPTDVALVEGSVATLRLPEDHDPDTLLARLAELEDQGIGWRRAEGFGEVTFWDSRHLDPLGAVDD